MTIKTHDFFQVHYPSKNYDGSSEDELAEIIMEEFHLYSNGTATKNYDTINPKKDDLALNLYPSFILLANKTKKSDAEKSQFINECLDDEFVNFLTMFNPIYKLMDFIEYHFLLYKGEKQNFAKHIKYSIISLIQKRKKYENGKDFDKYEEIENLVLDWVASKKENNENNNLTTYSSNKIKVTNNINNSQASKDDYKFIAILIPLAALIVYIIAEWQNIVVFFTK